MKNIIVIFGLISVIFVVDGQELFSCDFDTNNCGGTQSSNGGFNYYFTLIDIISLEAYSVTDVSSITKPTSDGYVCEIPFFSPPVPRPYYHCTPTWTCKTEVSITQAEMAQVKCFQGKFLIGRTNLVSGPFPMNVQYTTPDIDLESSGAEEEEYELSFYLMMFCFSDPDLQPCIDSGDHLSVMVLESDTDTVILNLDYTYDGFYPEDIVEKRMWIEKTVVFSTQASEIKIRVQFERKIGNAIVGSFGFDSLSLKTNRTVTTMITTEQTTELISTTEDYISTSISSIETSDETVTSEETPTSTSATNELATDQTTLTLTSKLPTSEPVVTIISTIEAVTPEKETNPGSSSLSTKVQSSTNPTLVLPTATLVEITITTAESTVEWSTKPTPTLAPITQPNTSISESTEEGETSTKSPDSGLNVYHWIGIGVGAILTLLLLFGISYCIYKLCCYRHSEIYPRSTTNNKNYGNDFEMS